MINGIFRVRSSQIWSGVLITIGSVLGLLASLMLSLEAYWRALNPKTIFACDVNAKLSCSTVAESWQSTLIHWPGNGAVPNAFLGLIVFSVFVTIGVLVASGVSIPRWVEWGFRIGVVIAFIFSTWLLQQSVFVIGAMCPWCLTMDLGTVLLAFGTWRQWALGESEHHGGVYKFTIGLESLLAAIVILAALIVAVLIHYWQIF
jgi:uncharacterized membrane protein